MQHVLDVKLYVIPTYSTFQIISMFVKCLFYIEHCAGHRNISVSKTGVSSALHKLTYNIAHEKPEAQIT